MYNEFIENKQEVCDAILNLIRLTSNLGDDRYNSVIKMEFIPKGTKCEGDMSKFIHNGVATEDFVRPIFKDGNGNSGYYDVVVSGDNAMGLIYDVMTKFVFKM